MICADELATIYEELHSTIMQYLFCEKRIFFDEAEEIYHLAIYRFWRYYNRERKPLNYIISICNNILVDRARKKKIEEKAESRLIEDIEESGREAVKSQDVSKILERYKGRTYTVLRLIYEGWSREDIKQQLGISTKKLNAILLAVREEENAQGTKEV